MSRLIKFLLGMCMGASVLAAIVAYAWTFVVTGRLAIPEGKGFRFLEVEEAAARFQGWIDGFHGETS